jgi:hypothetical protein
VRVVKFVIKNSIEQKILEIQQRKRVRLIAFCNNCCCRFANIVIYLQALAGTIANAPSPHEAAAARIQDLQALLRE